MDKRNKIRGCMIGGAVGDALGYAVEFLTEDKIFAKYGKAGITDYELTGGTALISDDTQMTMFTAAALLDGAASGQFTESIAEGYRDWYRTQIGARLSVAADNSHLGRLMSIPELYSNRAPGNTCLSALRSERLGAIGEPINNSKGCGGVMRAAPIGLLFANGNFPAEAAKEADMLGAKAAALTHGHELG
ncbi:MAG: ADP-ribosylglycohydrolase family protein, partial [Oscillospiraceae bacterium]|nr:ADP-ribosylglycohydrolase family protein [Oscillospiraceae bacterium]